MAYPDPTAAGSTPRPYALDDESPETSQSQAEPSPFASHISSVWGPSSTSSGAYLTLDDYFQLGTANFAANTDVDPSQPDTDGEREGNVLLDDYRSPYATFSLDRGRLDESSSAPESSPSPKKSTRGRGRSRGAPGRPRRGWKKLIQGTEHADLFKTPRLKRQAGGRDMRARGSRRGGARPSADPGPQFKKMQGKAMEAWIRQDYQAAEQFALEAVTINPEVYEAHALISEALLAQGRDYEALFAKHVGAPVARDRELFFEIGQNWIEMYHKGHGADCLERALACFREAIKGQGTNCDVRRGMRDAYVLQEDYNKAKLISKSIVRFEPADLENVQKYAEFCAAGRDTEDITRAIEAYDEAFRLHQHKDSIGDENAQWTYLNVYIDLLDRLGRYNEAIFQLKSKARWFLGRKDENFWDRISEDDREFDGGNERRNYVWEYQQGRASRDMEKYGDGLPIELRVKLGVLRLKMGRNHNEEAKRHLNYILFLQDEVDELHDLFVISAEALRSSGLVDSAIDFYEVAKRNPEYLSVTNFMHLADCYRTVEDDNGAIICYLSVIEKEDEHVPARVQLAKLYEAQGRREEAQEIADEVIHLGHEKTLRREKILMEKKKSGRKPGGTTKAQEHRRPMVPVRDLPPLAPMPAVPSELSPLNMAPSNEAMLPLIPPHVSPTQPTFLVDRPQTPDHQDEMEVDTPQPVREWKTKRTGLKRLGRLQQQKIIVHDHYAVVKELWPALEDNDEDVVDEWMIHATAMLDEFRSMKAFFPKRDRFYKFRGLRGLADADAMEEMEALKERLRGEGDGNDEEAQAAAANAFVSDQFHEIPFLEWFRIAFDIAALYAKQAEQEKCYEIIREVLQKATVFRHDAELANLAVAFSIYCGLLFDDSSLVAEAARHHIISSDFKAGAPYQLMAALVRLVKGEDSAYQDASLDKFIFRCARIRDHACMPEEMRKQSAWGDEQEESRLEDRLAKFGADKDGLDAGLLTLHGHVLASTKSGKYGPGGTIHPMSYFFRALALQPDNLTINLTIATIFLKGSAYRTTINRQFGFTQALSFFYRYYERRVADGKASHAQEAEFNLGRMWHQLGLTHLAVKSYEKVLQLSDAVQQEARATDDARGVGDDGIETEDFAREAAFSLQQLFAIAGNMEAAQTITEEWLVL